MLTGRCGRTAASLWRVHHPRQLSSPLVRALSTSDSKVTELHYESPLAASVRSLKRVSLTTAALSLTIPPALILNAVDNVPLSGQIAVTCVTLGASLGSTALIHYLTCPYVLSMRRLTGEGTDVDTFEATTMSLFGFEKKSSFQLSQVEPQPNTARPFVSFRAADRFYFIHGSMFDDKRLLRRLLGRPLKEDEE